MNSTNNKLQASQPARTVVTECCGYEVQENFVGTHNKGKLLIQYFNQKINSKK